MSREARLIRWLAFAFIVLMYAAVPLRAREDSGGDAGAQTGSDSQVGSQDSPQSAQPAPQDNPNPAPSDAQATQPQAPPAASRDSTKDSRKAVPESHTYRLTSDYSVALAPEWTPSSSDETPPPPALSAYAPFHLSGNLVLSNIPRGAILEFAISNNPFIGHDAYWLDTQMHAPSGTGMSLLDFFFYYLFPPSDACMHQVLTTYAPASRQSPTEGPAYLQVYYACPPSDTLSDFYSAQISAGITFQHTDDGTRILAPVGDFYVAPMEQVDESGMTFYVFEAQGMNAVSSDATKRFHLPANAQGGEPDFFWAFGSPSPFPFVADANTKDVPILHVAYARLGVAADAKSEFLNILRQVRAH
jgi:hypothetical protein